VLILSFILAWVSQPGDLGTLKAYRGPNGQVVELLALRQPSGARADARVDAQGLARVTGADSPHDGLVLPCEIRRSERGARWVTRHDGGDWGVADEREGTLAVNLPGRPAFRATFDAALTAAAKPGDVVEAHRAQREAGALRLFQRKALPKVEARYQAQAGRAIAAVSEACGATLAFEFDWGSIEDEVMAEVDVWKACAPITSHLAGACAKAKPARVVVCALGPAFALESRGDRLIFTTTPAGAKDASRFLDARE
jgi:hypothetical protein